MPSSPLTAHQEVLKAQLDRAHKAVLQALMMSLSGKWDVGVGADKNRAEHENAKESAVKEHVEKAVKAGEAGHAAEAIREYNEALEAASKP